MIKKVSLSIVCFVSIFQIALASKSDSIHYKHRWFAYWGYNREFFSNSNIELKGTNYDLNFYQVKARDKPYPFNLKNYVDPVSLWVPQYNYRLGFNLTERIGISLGLDHMKYIMDNSQYARVSGYVNANTFPDNSAAQVFNYNQPTELTRDFLFLTHTNGLNLLSLDVDYRTPLFKNHFIKINLDNGFGTAATITRTQVRIEGYGSDNYFHLCGYSFSAYQGFEILFGKYFFLRPQLRCGWVNLPAFLINTKSSPDRGKQNFAFVEGMLVAGSYFR